MRFLSNLVSSLLGTLIAIGLLFMLGFLFVVALAASTGRTPAVRSGSVLTIELRGAVPEVVADDPFAQAFSDLPQYDLRDFKRSLRKAAADDRIRAVRINTEDLEVQWATLQEMRSALVAFKESGKPVFASCGDLGMGEAELFLASAADSIFAQPEAPFEFNGFEITNTFFQGALNRLNIEPRVYRAGRYKSAVEPFTRQDLSASNEAQLRALLDAQNRVFMRTVGQSRGLSADSLEYLADERGIVNAEDAARLGLIDGLLYHDQVDSLFRSRLGLAEGEDIPNVRLDQYARVPASDAGLEEGDAGEIAVVYAVGAISSGESGPSPNPLTGGQALGAETFRRAMTEARESEEIEAVVVRVNSPGGAVAPSEAMSREMTLTQRQKPVIVSMGDVAASGGYWLSTPADTIVANPLTLTGSIGVFGITFDMREFYNSKLGITFDGVQSSPLADLQSSIADVSEQERQLLQSSVDDIYQAFLRNVARGRNMSVAQADSIAQGRVWTGVQAKNINLVDVLGGLEDAVRIAAEKSGLEEDTYRVRTLPRPRSFLERLARSMEAQAAQTWMQLRTSEFERMLLDQLHVLKDLAKMQDQVQARLPFSPHIE